MATFYLIYSINAAHLAYEDIRSRGGSDAIEKTIGIGGREVDSTAVHSSTWGYAISELEVITLEMPQGLMQGTPSGSAHEAGDRWYTQISVPDGTAIPAQYAPDGPSSPDKPASFDWSSWLDQDRNEASFDISGGFGSLLGSLAQSYNATGAYDAAMRVEGVRDKLYEYAGRAVDVLEYGIANMENLSPAEIEAFNRGSIDLMKEAQAAFYEEFQEQIHEQIPAGTLSPALLISSALENISISLSRQGEDGKLTITHEEDQKVVLGEAKNFFIASPGMERVVGGDGSDTVINTDGDSSFPGAFGDNFDLLGGDDVFAGSVAWENVWGGDGKDSLYGFGGGDEINGGRGDDSLFGGTGDDQLMGDQGADLVDGGDGEDTVSYSGQRGGYVVSASADRSLTIRDINSSDGDDGTDAVRAVEFLNFAGQKFSLADVLESEQPGGSTGGGGSSGGADGPSGGGDESLPGDEEPLPGDPSPVSYISGWVGIDFISTTDGKEVISLLAGDDFVFATVPDGDKIDGGDGRDVVSYIASKGTASFQRVAEGLLVEVDDPVLGLSAPDELLWVERVTFTDGVLALDTGVGENAGSAYRIYQAAFDRTPDEEGLEFWIGDLDKGVSLRTVAEGFLRAPEFTEVYGENVSNADFVARLYENILQRPGEAEGVTHWMRVLDDNLQDRADVLAGFSESPENVALVAPAIDDGIWYV